MIEKIESQPLLSLLQSEVEIKLFLNNEEGKIPDELSLDIKVNYNKK
jgi:hypothetical protein